MVNSGLMLSHLHLVGFSLGSHVAGLAGRCVSDKTDDHLNIARYLTLLRSYFILTINNYFANILRITGLDPSINGFTVGTLNSEHLDELSDDDASFVDVIHTDAGFHGISKQSGTVDFWPNYGHRFQPGCSLTNIFNPETASDGTKGKD